MTDISRRDFLKLASLVSLQSCATPGLAFTTESLEVSTFRIHIPNLPLAFHNFKIGFVSDLHLGPFVSKSFLRSCLKKLHGVNVLLVGGDIINLPEKSLFRELFGFVRDEDYNVFKESAAILSKRIFHDVAKLIADVKTTDGTFAVYGNHDRWINGKECAYYLEKFGIRLLTNTSHTIAKGDATLDLIGFDDYWTGKPDVSKGFEKINKNSLAIVLNHNPDFIPEILNYGAANAKLILGGHTHGGQIRLPLLGALVQNIKHKEYAIGTCIVNDCHIFTSRGLGVVEIPHRINCPPEASIFELLPEIS